MSARSLVALCREGFEPETGTDLRQLAAHAGLGLESVAAGAGHVIGTTRVVDASAWFGALAGANPVFARSASFGTGPHDLGPGAPGGRADRITPLLTAIAALPARSGERARWRSVWVEFPDTNAGKAMSTLAHALESRLAAALGETGHLAPEAPCRLHVFLAGRDAAYTGESPAMGGPAWPMGIARLRMPREAPSRSTLKLAEAIAVFLGDHETRLLRPGQRAVDLGAAPGGWTWQLVQRGLRVTAVDNGPLKGGLAQDPLVEHLAADGFRYRPRRPVDWLVCDMVEQPRRVAELVARWIADGAARRAIFNLKLPMKKRYDEVTLCEQRIGAIMTRAGLRFTLRLRQLYHDREEVTGYLARID